MNFVFLYVLWDGSLLFFECALLCGLHTGHCPLTYSLISLQLSRYRRTTLFLFMLTCNRQVLSETHHQDILLLKSQAIQISSWARKSTTSMIPQPGRTSVSLSFAQRKSSDWISMTTRIQDGSSGSQLEITVSKGNGGLRRSCGLKKACDMQSRSRYQQ